jgi:hypothetical protein
MSDLKSVIITACFFASAFLRPASAFEVAPVRVTEQTPVLQVVFYPLHYASDDDLAKDIAWVWRQFGKVKPFDEFIAQISVYSLRGLTPADYVKHCQPVTGIPPIKISAQLVEDIGARVGGPYKLVVIDAKGGVSCAELSHPRKTSLIIIGKARYNNNLDYHELGHALGLRDECADCPALGSPGPPNCARTRQEAESFWGDLFSPRSGRVGYYRGCSGNTSYFRPTAASLMNDVARAADFGPVNERYLRLVLAGY